MTKELYDSRKNMAALVQKQRLPCPRVVSGTTAQSQSSDGQDWRGFLQKAAMFYESHPTPLTRRREDFL